MSHRGWRVSVALLAATVPADPKMQTHCDRWAGTSSVGSPFLGSLEGSLAREGCELTADLEATEEGVGTARLV